MQKIQPPGEEKSRADDDKKGKRPALSGCVQGNHKYAKGHKDAEGFGDAVKKQVIAKTDQVKAGKGKPEQGRYPWM